jgi:hypothetical protein
MRILLIILCSVALLAGVSTAAKAADTPASIQPDTALAAFKKATREKYNMKEKAFADHDADTIVTRFYTKDAISVGQGFGIFIGRDQLRPLFAKAVNQYTVKITSVHTKVKGNAGWDWVDFAVMPVDPKDKAFTLAMLFLWVKQDGNWMCQGDFYVDGSFATGKLNTSS